MSENTGILPQIKVNEPEPLDDNPWADDKLARKACAEKLTAVIQGQIAPMTISVNGEWGSGKTFMLKRWQKQLTKDGYTAIYFNAWEDDFLADPLVAILGQLQSVLISKLGDQVKKELSVAYRLFRNTGLRFVSAGCADPGDLTPDKNLLDIYAEGIESRAKLRIALEKLIAKLQQDRMPLVFIVDELDRCRPTFAIEVLERIKHFFNINHMIFVLGIDRENLGKSIQSVYGDIDVGNYLHRFVDLELVLMPAENTKLFEVLWLKHNIEACYQNVGSSMQKLVPIEGKDVFKDSLKSLLSGVSPRVMDHCLKIICAASYRSPSNCAVDVLLLAIMIVLKIRAPGLYSKYVASECNPSEVIDYLLSQATKDGHQNIMIEAVVYLSYTSTKDSPISNGVKELFERLYIPTSNEDELKYASEHILTYVKKHKYETLTDADKQSMHFLQHQFELKRMSPATGRGTDENMKREIARNIEIYGVM